MRKLLVTIAAIIMYLASFSQAKTSRLKVFIDCSDTWCDMTYIRSKIKIVDFMLDQKAADVHVLITEQDTGGGGDEFQLIFFGQKKFKLLNDTIRFNTDANETDFEERENLLKYLTFGLMRYIARTDEAKYLKLELKLTDDTARQSVVAAVKDPWNYWVYRIGANGNIGGEESYRNRSFNGNFSANRVTDQSKIGFEVSGGKNTTVYYATNDSGVEEKTIIKNNNYSIWHYLVKSINDHWSWAYQGGISHTTFSNNKNTFLMEAGIEYAVFPYKDVNTRFFTISYAMDIRYNRYIDTTLYDKIGETLTGHTVKAKMTFNQKWGTVSTGIDYHNYFHNWKFLRLGADVEIDIRITGGLSFNVYTFAQLSRDQLYLPKEGATVEDVLTRRRQLATGYNFSTHFGIRYRFGSKLNNFVNPRFDD